MPYLGIFRLYFKKLLSYLISAPSNLSNCKILQRKKKCPNFRPNMPYLSIFGAEL